jgi:large subunit ribosomal protein L4
MLIDVYNQKGEKVEQAELPSEVFEVKLSQDLVHQVVVSQTSNQRQGTAHTKGRGEVSGGGKKPWRQKGTGRARHGSIRSPIWRGGGVVFGPTNEKNYKKIIPKKMRRKALFMILSEKAKNNLLLILDSLELENPPKTKAMKEILDNLFAKNLLNPVSLAEAQQFSNHSKPRNPSTILLVLPEKNENIIKAARNLPKIAVIEARNLNILDLLNYKYLLMSKLAIETIKETFLEKI